MTVARRLVVPGRVQGVNYRGWLRERAVARGVAGWAVNAFDGTVDVWLEGDADAVAAVERAAAQGPRHAEVRGVDASDEQPRGVSGFDRR